MRGQPQPRDPMSLINAMTAPVRCLSCRLCFYRGPNRPPRGAWLSKYALCDAGLEVTENLLSEHWCAVHIPLA